MSELKPPQIGRPLTAEEIVGRLTEADALQEMAWALRDWNHMASRLTQLGVPDRDELDNWASMEWRVNYAIQHGLLGGDDDVDTS